MGQRLVLSPQAGHGRRVAEAERRDRARCVSTTSPGPPSRSASTSCGRSPRGSSGSGSPGSAGAPPGSATTAGSHSLPRRPRVPRRPAGARRVGASRDDRGPRPPAPAVAALDARPARHAAVRRPGRALRVQPQRRPARLPSALRATYRAQGRIHGRADTEVGARWLEDAWRPTRAAAHLLGALHDRFGGQANLAVLTADGTPHHYAGNGENPVFTFRLAGSAWPRPGSTRSTGRSSGSSRRAPRSAGWCRRGRPSRWTVTAAPVPRS